MLQRGRQFSQLKVAASLECRLAYRLKSFGQVDAFDVCLTEGIFAYRLDSLGQNHLTALLRIGTSVEIQEVITNGCNGICLSVLGHECLRHCYRAACLHMVRSRHFCCPCLVVAEECESITIMVEFLSIGIGDIHRHQCHDNQNELSHNYIYYRVLFIIISFLFIIIIINETVTFIVNNDYHSATSRTGRMTQPVILRHVVNTPAEPSPNPIPHIL